MRMLTLIKMLTKYSSDSALECTDAIVIRGKLEQCALAFATHLDPVARHLQEPEDGLESQLLARCSMV